MDNFLPGVAIVLLFVAILIRLKPDIILRFMERGGNKISPPMGVKWWIKHPNGSKMLVEYKFYNCNRKLFWKLHGVEQPFAAEMVYDVFEEEGAVSGNGYYYCRFNPNGSEIPWGNPAWKTYFEQMTDLRDELDDRNANEQRKNETKISKFRVGHAKESRRVDAAYTVALIEEKKMAALLKYGFGKSRIPRILKQKPVFEEDEKLGE